MDLIIMAGGLGSRYGKKKQFEKVYEHKTIIDYSIEFAFQTGFSRIVLIISQDSAIFIEHEYRTLISAGKLTYIVQVNSHIPEKYKALAVNRKKPWGTAHILYMLAKHHISDIFCLINADDFYGKQAFEIAADFAKSNPNKQGLVSYLLGKTLSDNGPVSRAYCELEPVNSQPGGGYKLKEILELKRVRRIHGNIHADNTAISLQEDSPVSLNFWILRKENLADIEARFEMFLSDYDPNAPSQDEFLIPDYIRYLIGRNIVFEAKQNPGCFFSLTYETDMPALRAHLLNRQSNPFLR